MGDGESKASSRDGLIFDSHREVGKIKVIRGREGRVRGSQMDRESRKNRRQLASAERQRNSRT